ncbi:hypothetical protein Tco_1183789 [Tanacetum coccineum]
MSGNDNFSLHDDEELFLPDEHLRMDLYRSNIRVALLRTTTNYPTTNYTFKHLKTDNWELQRSESPKVGGVYRVLPPTTRKNNLLMRKKVKLETLLLHGCSKRCLSCFHGMDDAKEIWAAIKTRFGGNANSKKMQKAVLKQQFEAFNISSKESLEKGYGRFQILLSQLMPLGQSSHDNETKKNIDTLSIDDLYNNLSVFEQDIQKTSSSSLTSDNVFDEMDINWADCYDAIKIKSSTRDWQNGQEWMEKKNAVAFDKRKKSNVFNCQNTGHFAQGVQFFKRFQRKGSRQGQQVEVRISKPVRTGKEALMTIDEGQISIG